MDHSNRQWSHLLWISLAELFALSVWFSGTAVSHQLYVSYHSTAVNPVWLTISVQIGFILGALVSSFFALSDRYSAKRLFVICSLLAGVLNLLLMFMPNAWLGILMRGLTGITLAGVYPTAVKILSSHFQKRKGLAIGVLIGALTMGSNLPHFILFFTSTLDWKVMIEVSSALAWIAGIVMWLFVVDNHQKSSGQAVSTKQLARVFGNQRVMLSNFGYFGHMWELYAAWTWLPVFLIANAKSETTGSIVAFVTIGLFGAVGCVIGGLVADWIGKANLTILAMAVSATCALVIGFTNHTSWWVTVTVAGIWGVFVIADSAQFSASVTDHAEPEYIGTALAFQMSVGFLITTISIYLLPVIVSWVTWRYAFMVLAIGPVFGIVSMSRLKSITSLSSRGESYEVRP
ncbi:MFS transporter [Alicyclobacillus ferrooxydans]|uniref:MFS transporter n=1 Tax=Alicyclobacillus ferrooxydans TaxID=471514 RepID=A0A0P9CZU2_9BACL|nr:MFS transporter [Alicyclobacillus ferrooxydans]KPV45254.1 MFS transporter [Alicyclobacillus ferrooxydans]